MSTRRCLCVCHCGGVGDRQRADGVDVADPIDAITACTECRRHHCEAFLETALPNESPSPRSSWVSAVRANSRPTTENGEFLPPPTWKGEDGG